MKRPIFFLVPLALAATAPAVPASAIVPAGFDCGADDGRERLTTQGFQLEFQGPTPPGPFLEGVPDNVDPTLKIHSTAHFAFRTVFVPYQSGDLEFTLDWVEQGDFDMYVLDEAGTVLESSTDFNPLDGNGERMTLAGVAHCTDLRLEVRNYLGQPDEPLTLNVAFKNPGPAFACEKDDPHPACAGKAEGEAPALLPDARTRLYLTSDRPGQASMVGDYVFETAGAGEPPMRGRLSATRPTGGRTNSFTHTALGFTNQQQNPFHAHFNMRVSGPTPVKGELTAVVWVSSQTMKDGGTLHVDLFMDGTGPLPQTQVARRDVPGTNIGATPTRLAVTFTGLDLTVESELVLQISSEPLATTGGQVGNPADAEWTVYYDSVQFPSFVALDLPAGAIA